MKKLILPAIIILWLSAFACSGKKQLDWYPDYELQNQLDSAQQKIKIISNQPLVVQIPDSADKNYDSLLSRLLLIADSVRTENYLLKKENKVYRNQLFLANYKLEKIRFYIKICMRKPSQDKFLKGWIRRVVEQ